MNTWRSKKYLGIGMLVACASSFGVADAQATMINVGPVTFIGSTNPITPTVSDSLFEGTTPETPPPVNSVLAGGALMGAGFGFADVSYALNVDPNSTITFTWDSYVEFTANETLVGLPLNIAGFADFGFTGGTANVALLSVTGQILDSVGPNQPDPSDPPATFSSPNLAVGGNFTAWNMQVPINLTAGSTYYLDMTSTLVVSSGTGGTVHMDPEYTTAMIPEPPSCLLLAVSLFGASSFAAIRRWRTMPSRR